MGTASAAKPETVAHRKSPSDSQSFAIEPYFCSFRRKQMGSRLGSARLSSVEILHAAGRDKTKFTQRDSFRNQLARIRSLTDSGAGCPQARKQLQGDAKIRQIAQQSVGHAAGYADLRSG